MSRHPRCTICRRSDRKLIEEALRSGRGYREIARDYGTSKSVLGRHLAHMGGQEGSGLPDPPPAHAPARAQAPREAPPLDGPPGPPEPWGDVEDDPGYVTNSARCRIRWIPVNERYTEPGPVKVWDPLHGENVIDHEATARRRAAFHEARLDEEAFERLRRQRRGKP